MDYVDKQKPRCGGGRGFARCSFINRPQRVGHARVARPICIQNSRSAKQFQEEARLGSVGLLSAIGGLIPLDSA